MSQKSSLGTSTTAADVEPLSPILSRQRPPEEDYPKMNYSYEKRTKTVTHQPILNDHSLMLLSSSLTDDDLQRKITEGQAEIKSRVNEIFSDMNNTYTEHIQSRTENIVMPKYMDPRRYENQTCRPVGVLVHQNFPVSSVETYRYKGEITEKMLKRNDRIHQVGETDMFLGLLNFYKKRCAQGKSDACFKIRRFKFKPF